MKILQTIPKYNASDDPQANAAENLQSRGDRDAHFREPESVTSLLEENQKLIAIGRMMASISHEINNPLESVTNLLFLIGQEQNLPLDVRHYLQIAQRELSRVVQISKQTLSFYRDASIPVPVSLEDLLEEVLVLYRQKIAEKRLILRREYAVKHTVDIFPGEMRQVLSNLIVNAIEAMPEGGTLRLRLHASRQWSDSRVHGLRITIADNGGGIDPETMKRLGTPFLTTKGQSGTGLGLWVAMSIIERNRGHLHIRSSVHPTRHGTAFTIFLPTNRRPQAVPRPASVTQKPGEEPSLGRAC